VKEVKMVNPLTRFEDLAERLIEGSAARLLNARLQPVELARYLARAMEDGQVVGPQGHMIVPNAYWVRLHPNDFDALSSFRETLEDELARYVASLARAAGATMAGRPRVRLLGHSSVPLRRARVVARVVSPRPQNADLTRTQDWSPAVAASAHAASASLTPAAFVLTYAGRRMPISESVISIGRSLDNDIVLEEPGVSRLHAQLRRRYGQYVLYDLGSRSGTSVNGRPVREAPLEHGDVLALGGAEIRFEALAGATTPAPLRDQTQPLGQPGRAGGEP
jgi:hypothetical protein